jgi:methylenetetrahydrofolate reductase (NADPH)
MESAAPERQWEEGVRIALEIVDEVRQIPGVRGVHLMSIKNEAAIVRVIEESGLLPRPARVPPAAVG